MKQMFRVRLKAVHDSKKLTPYAVYKGTGISQTTVAKYTKTDEVLIATLPPVVARLAAFYGEDWRNPDIVDIVDSK